jgi:SAM-dependent methyltransferase
MLRRTLDLEPTGNVKLVGLDEDARNLSAGVDRMEQVLRSRGWEIAEVKRGPEARSIRGRKEATDVRVEFLQGELLDPNTTGGLQPFDFVTAHAFMDLIPLDRGVSIIRKLLKPGGVFYSTLNYDGLTLLLPEYEDPGFERLLLRIYNRSMELRRIGSRKTGGSLSGRRLYQALLDGAFRILEVGPSDWSVFPPGGGYTEGQQLFLTAVLSMIEEEARRYRREPGGGIPAVSPERLDLWYSERLEAVRNHRLSLIVHQLDLLAEPG